MRKWEHHKKITVINYAILTPASYSMKFLSQPGLISLQGGDALLILRLHKTTDYMKQNKCPNGNKRIIKRKI